MFLPRISQPSCASGWLAASQAVYSLPGHEGHHVVIDIDHPACLSEQDAAVVRVVDAFLAAHTENAFLVRTVANTIFPQATYETHGSPDFYDVYINKVFPRLKRSPRDWGRYFERMMAYPSTDGPKNLLADIVTEMKRNVAAERTFRNIYELPIYNPMKDRTGSPIGRQCLSYMSFKLDDENRLLLSALFRNHFYTEKLLGNLIGLGRLMAFVAAEVGVTVGPLSVLSTHAHVDAAGATQIQLKELHVKCAEILATPSTARAA
jgi:thymidylate synthase